MDCLKHKKFGNNGNPRLQNFRVAEMFVTKILVTNSQINLESTTASTLWPTLTSLFDQGQNISPGKNILLWVIDKKPFYEKDIKNVLQLVLTS